MCRTVPVGRIEVGVWINKRRTVHERCVKRKVYFIYQLKTKRRADTETEDAIIHAHEYFTSKLLNNK
jgi:hypothetical protein